MGDALKKVQSGEPLAIPATAYNAFIDAARAHRAAQQEVASQPRPGVAQTTIVPIRNDSGADRDRFDILGINGPLFTPTAALEQFKNRVVLTGGTPGSGHTANFAALLEPVKAGKIAAACIAGVCPARINVQNQSHLYADVASGSAANLQSGVLGAAFIVWKESGTGVKWSIVNLRGPASDRGTATNPLNLTFTGESDHGGSPNTTTWDVTNQGAYNGVRLSVCSLPYYDHTLATPVLKAFKRDWTISSTGAVLAISAETEFNIDTPEACS
ncbi:MAG: hypothetical protein IT442_09690 [Phycisphaeraceae bacterium]|nr:hypothetical protein [Phycisphaeraceae bacterium]